MAHALRSASVAMVLTAVTGKDLASNTVFFPIGDLPPVEGEVDYTKEEDAFVSPGPPATPDSPAFSYAGDPMRTVWTPNPTPSPVQIEEDKPGPVRVGSTSPAAASRPSPIRACTQDKV